MIYLDHNATTPLAPAVIDTMTETIKAAYGNPSSAHAAGRASRAIIEDARESVAELLGARLASEIVFTSGGTESDNLAILGALAAAPEKRHIVTTRVEHEAVRRLAEKLETNGYEITWIDVAGDGSIDIDGLSRSLRADTAVVSVMLANNETGVIFPMREIGEAVKGSCSALFHVDGVNAAGKVAIDLGNENVDLFSISAHKFHGPKGVGALYAREGVKIAPIMSGGGQESGRRPGTEAVHQIAGLGAAAKFACDLSYSSELERLRDRLENEILAKIPRSRVNGTTDREKRLPNTTNISFENTNGEMIVSRLDDAGICVSTGSACNSESRESSAVLRAMDVPYIWAMGSIRFSLGRHTSEADIERVIDVLPGIVEELRRMS